MESKVGSKIIKVFLEEVRVPERLAFKPRVGLDNHFSLMFDAGFSESQICTP